ncbi:hypothetical protein N2152v2_001662 [Parachlorella kessleri]
MFGSLGSRPAHTLVFPALPPGRCHSSSRRRGSVTLAALQPAPGGHSSDGDAGGALGSETVTQWLARHARDPADIQRQQPIWDSLQAACGGPEAAAALVSREPGLLAMPAALVASNLEVMRGLRLMPADIAACISRCPSLFVCNDLASDDFLAKLRFFREVLGRPVRQVLAKQPHLLMRSLSGMECKVAFMQHQGCEEYRRTLTWVNMSNPDFCWHFNFDEAEFEEWEAEWEAH